MGTATGYTKAEVDRLIAAVLTRSMVNLPPVGKYLTPAGVTGYGYNNEAPYGYTTFVPIEVPAGGTFDAFRTRISGARSGGAGTLRRFGLYRSAPSGLPLGSGRVASATINDAATTGGNGGDFVFAEGAQALAAGRYWFAHHVSATTNPTTPATLLVVTNATYSIGTDDQNAPDAVARSLLIGPSQTDLPTADITESAWLYNKGNYAPVAVLRRSA